MKTPFIEVLVFDGCPYVELTVERARAAVATAGVIQADVRVVRVESGESALEQRCLGSPTVRVDGRDVEPGADA
jgi:phosphopantothenate synthetase